MKDHEKLEAIGAYLVQYPPSGFTDRYSAAGWAHIARAVLSAASIFGRAPHGEDHDAGLRAALERIHAYAGDHASYGSRLMNAVWVCDVAAEALARVSPSRDRTVAVEDVERLRGAPHGEDHE